MNDVDIFFITPKNTFDFIELFFLAGSGFLIGLAVGIIMILIINKAGLLYRRLYWHNYLLKIYFILVPVCMALFGAQAVTVYGAQVQTKKTIEIYRPYVRAWSDKLWSDFIDNMDTEKVAKLLDNVDKIGAIATAELLVDTLLSKQNLPAEDFTTDTTVSEHIFSMINEFIHSKTIRTNLVNVITNEISRLSGASEETVRLVLDTPVRDILSGDVLIDLLLKKLDTNFMIFYWLIFFQFILLFLFIVAEILISRIFKLSKGK